ncbi:hypothetical protein [Porticoccus sp.]
MRLVVAALNHQVVTAVISSVAVLSLSTGEEGLFGNFIFWKLHLNCVSSVSAKRQTLLERAQ